MSYNNDLVINGITDKSWASLGYFYRNLIGTIKMEWLYDSLNLCKLISVFVSLSIYETTLKITKYHNMPRLSKNQIHNTKNWSNILWLWKSFFVNCNKNVDNSDGLDNDLYENVIVYSCIFCADKDYHTLHM